MIKIFSTLCSNTSPLHGAPDTTTIKDKICGKKNVIYQHRTAGFIAITIANTFACCSVSSIFVPFIILFHKKDFGIFSYFLFITITINLL